MSFLRIVASLAVSLAIPLVSGARAQSAGPQVKVGSGTLAGVRAGDTVAFKGILYAAPPVGDLRWRAPQPAKPWQGVRAADKMGAVCQQNYSEKDNGVGPPPVSEDCLTLNVFAPADARDAPVMFWIHGGGFVNGSGTAALYDGAALARQGVVVVTINYRLGWFGFFAHPALTASAKGEPTGNYALMDMIAALKWVRTNIARFGGDPQKVTIFGESAGGLAVHDLMVSPAARGLFARAAAQSGAGSDKGQTLVEAEKSGVAFAAAAGLKDATASDLRKLTPEQIMAAGPGDFTGAGGVILDGRILTVSPMQGFRTGQEAKVPYLIGWNSLELPYPASAVAPQLVKSGITAVSVERIKAIYPDADAYENGLVRDLGFTEPSYELAKMHSARGNPAFVYQFSVIVKGAPPMFKGALHGGEREYVFNNLSAGTFPAGPNDAVQSRTMSAYWVAFAKTGNPNGDGRPVWPAFTESEGRIIDFTNDGPKATPVPRLATLKAIRAAYP